MNGQTQDVQLFVPREHCCDATVCGLSNLIPDLNVSLKEDEDMAAYLYD